MTKPNKTLVKFIQEARKRGFSDLESRGLMAAKNWPITEIEKAFLSLQPKFKFKNEVCIFLNDEISERLQERADKNLLTIPEQIEDILRRSCINKKKKVLTDNVDDPFLAFFSRKKK